MEMNEVYQGENKEPVNRGNTEQLYAFADQIVAFRDPVLIIGLGGTGIDAMLATKKLVYQKITGKEPSADISRTENEKSTSIADRPRNIEYLGIDTDEASLSHTCQGVGLNQEDGEILICPCADLSSMAAHPEDLPENITGWLDPALLATDNEKPQAMPVRQMGRLALMLHAEEVTAVLEKKIYRVTKEFAEDTVLWVFLITGLCGGTGSGMLLDASYLVRAVSSDSNSRPVRTVGMFFLPEVSTDKPGIPWDTKSRLTANGYALLKELDQLMSKENAGDVYTQDYGLPKKDMRVESAWKPFDFCLLYDGSSSYDQAIPAVAEIILTLITGNEDIRNESTGNPLTGTESVGIDACNLSRIHRWAADEYKRQSINQRKHEETMRSAGYGYTLVNLAYLGYAHLVENRMKAEGEASIPNVYFLKVDSYNYYFNFFCREITLSTDNLMDFYKHNFLNQRNFVRKELQRIGDVLTDFIEADCAEIPANKEQDLRFWNYEHALLKELDKYRDYFYKEMTRQSEQADSLLAQEPELRNKAKKGFLFWKRKKLAYKDLVEQFYRAKLDAWICEELLKFCAYAARLIDKRFRGMKKLPDIPADFFLEVLSRARGMSVERYFSTLVNELCERARKQESLNSAVLPDAWELSSVFYLTIPAMPAGWKELIEKQRGSIGKEYEEVNMDSSKTADGILAVHFQGSVPLIALKNIKKYEDTYMEIRDKSAGLHLYRMPGDDEKTSFAQKSEHSSVISEDGAD